MSLGRAPQHENLLRSTRAACEARLPERSIYRLLARECHRIFPDEAFADLFSDIGRCSVPPRIVAVTMVLQRIHGLSDREAADAFAFDLRWKFATGVDFDHPGFAHTVLVDMRERLRRSERPNRIFDVVLQLAKEAGLVGRKRVLDSTALYDAVATQDTVTLMRAAIRALLREAHEQDHALEAQLRSVLKRDDDYRDAGKPVCDWDDQAARDALIDALARDGFALIACLDDRELAGPLLQAAQLLASVLGQDLEQTDGGLFRIARRTVKDRIISTVDPDARHGHKTAARGFDGYKGHMAIDPDSELITATEVTAGNVGDGSVGASLLREVFDEAKANPPSEEKVEVYGDASYGTAELVEHIEGAGAEANVKVQGPSSRPDMFGKDAFRVDLNTDTVACPAGRVVPIARGKDGGGLATFRANCADCPLRAQCTKSIEGRSIRVHPHEATLQRSRERQRHPQWRARYRATRPKVERKFGHLMSRRHGGRRARVRGLLRVGQDFALLAAAANLKRLAALGFSLEPASF